MPYRCQRCGNYSTNDKGNFKSHLGSTKLPNHNMGPFVCQVPGCNVRSVRGDTITSHTRHEPQWIKDPALVAALDTELAASLRPAHMALPAAGPAPPIFAGPAPPTLASPGPFFTAGIAPPAFAGPGPSTFAGPAPSTFAGPASSASAGPAPSTFAGPAPSTFAGPAPSTSAATPSTTTSSTTASSHATLVYPFPLDPVLLAHDRALLANAQGTTHGASAQDEEDDNDDEDEDSTSASAHLRHKDQDILAHGEDEDTDFSDAGQSPSSRDYLYRTGVSPLVMEAMKLLSLSDPPPEKPLEWAGKWLLARSREYEGVDEEEATEEDENKVKKDDDKDEDKEEKEGENK